MTKEGGCDQKEEWIPVSGHWNDTIEATQMTKEDVIPPHPGVIPVLDTAIYELNGLKVKEARKSMIEILTKKGLLIESTNISHSVKCC